MDDDVLTRKLMSRMLTRLGCNVETAENGKVALEKILGSSASVATPSTEADLADLIPVPEGPTYDIVFLDNQMVSHNPITARFVG